MSKMVKNLTVNLQKGTDSTYYATWTFDESSTSTSSGIKKGNLVSIKSGATYYNGVAIPSWVIEDKWYISEINGNRAVLGKNSKKTKDIQSPIHTKYLTGGSSTSTTTKELDYYTVSWEYDTGNGIWFSAGSESNVTTKYATYSAPDNALQIRVKVKPVAKKRKVNGKDTAYWTGKTATKSYSTNINPPETPATPSVIVDKYKLTASLENISDARTDEIAFHVYNGNTLVNGGFVTVVTRRASFSCTITAGGEYRVRCKSVNLHGTNKIYGEWSDFSSPVSSIPTPPAINSCTATSETSINLKWSKVWTATSYDIEYTTEKKYFDGSDQTQTVTGLETTSYEKTGLESGKEYFFRVRSVNEQGHSAWSDIKSIIIGKKPSAPTTWSSTTTAITGSELKLYWVHNTEDGSKEVKAELELIIDGSKKTIIVNKSTDKDDEETTSVYTMSTSQYVEGTTIKWRVRTAGITNVYGDWSVQRTIDVYAPPVLELKVTDSSGEVLETLNSFPFYISATATPNTQTPIGYSVSVISNSIYETVDDLGNIKMVNKGEELYSHYYNTSSNPLLLEISAGSINLENGKSYTLICTVSMDSGLSTESRLIFDVSWVDESFEPNAAISIDSNTYSAYIRPYCMDEDDNLIPDITLSVYRREFDGTFTELMTGIVNTNNTTITDPHPSLDYARYRIVAIDNATGAVSYNDLPGYPMGCISAIIQWDEAWSNFDVINDDPLEQPAWSGSLLKLMYNIDVSDKHSSDVSLVEYIGRKHPVSYYGTQRGETSTWSMEIPKDDKETLYSLRRLSIWMGDVYVREPSGSGYWANISVSFDQKHKALTIPVTLDITRVEGGI